MATSRKCASPIWNLTVASWGQIILLTLRMKKYPYGSYLGSIWKEEIDSGLVALFCLLRFLSTKFCFVHSPVANVGGVHKTERKSSDFCEKHQRDYVFYI